MLYFDLKFIHNVTKQKLTSYHLQIRVRQMNYERYFPHKTVRPEQRRAIDFIIDQFMNENKRFVIVEAGTGVGKSAIAICISRFLSENLVDDEFQDTSYILTTQKILQKQYITDYSITDIEDFGKGISNISAATEYTCHHDSKTNCAEIQRTMKILPKNSLFHRTCNKERCVYKCAKRDFIANKEGVTNFAYFLAETLYAKEFKPRKLLVIDEAHNTDAELARFIDIVIDPDVVRMVSLDMPKTQNKIQLYNWVKEQYLPALCRLKETVEDDIEQYMIDPIVNKPQLLGKVKQNEILDKYLCKTNRFVRFFEENNWILNHDGSKSYEFKLISIAEHSGELLFQFGKKVLLMSATILDKNKFCQLNGIPVEQASFISVPSPFNLSNKPIYYMPIGLMNASAIDSSLPTLVQFLKKILKKHRDVKGIVHCHSYKVMEYIAKNIGDARVLSHDISTRGKVLEAHTSSPRPTVLLSPSMTEGVDLKDGLSRFQVICKIPYPYLGDELVKSKMKKWKWWYSYQTIITILQSVGRSIRSEDDFATTYILDGCWEGFYRSNVHIFPREFQKLLV